MNDLRLLQRLPLPSLDTIILTISVLTIVTLCAIGLSSPTVSASHHAVVAPAVNGPAIPSSAQ